MSTTLHRRDFLKGTAAVASGLVIGLYLPSQSRIAEAAVETKPFAPNAFLRIGTDNQITVIVKHSEMGQGISTALPMLVAEELDADWHTVKFEFAPAAPEYNHTVFPIQMTGGSTSVSNSYQQLRQAGATAKAMLVAAAAQQWQVEPDTCRVAQSVVYHDASKRQATFGELADVAAQQETPIEVQLKVKADFKLIGKPTKRLDSLAKVNGSAAFGMDVDLPDMLTAVIARPPTFGATVKSVDASATKAVKGVHEVVQVPAGVAVVADSFWQAKLGRDALKVEWDIPAASKVSSDDLFQQYHAMAEKPGKLAGNHGEAEQALQDCNKVVAAEYTFPYLAHAAMEPLNCTAQLSDDGCEIWTGSQFQTVDQGNIAYAAGIKPEKIRINTLMLGGGFGRRANITSDFVVEAVLVAKALGTKKPVKTVWLREDDTRGGYYRPMYVHHVRAGIKDGKPHAWHHRLVGQSILTNTPFEKFLVKDGIDQTSVEGITTLPYALPHLRAEYETTQLPVPTLWWRSVGHSHNAFVTESVIDELATLAAKDPVQFRLAALTEHPRHAGVLKLVAEKADWDKPLAQKDGVRRGRGVAVHESFHSYAAQIAEVSVQPDGQFSVDRVVCAIDCGTAVNPQTIEAQMQSAIVFGLSAALTGKITLQDGVVEQSNFHDYPVLRMDEMPKIEVHIVTSDAPPTGVGEPATPPIAPAVANALFVATGKRVRSLPIETAQLAWGAKS